MLEVAFIMALCVQPVHVFTSFFAVNRQGPIGTYCASSDLTYQHRFLRFLTVTRDRFARLQCFAITLLALCNRLVESFLLLNEFMHVKALFVN